VTLNHEIDVKHKSGNFSTAELPAQLQLITDFHRSVKRLREAGQIPNVVTCHVLAGWRWSGGTESPNAYLAEADVIGIDLDGANTRTGSTAYLDWTTPYIVNVKATAAAHYGGRWTVPEFGERRLDRDTTGSMRVAAYNTQVPKLAAAGAEDVLYFDNESDPAWEGYALVSSDEIAMWRAFVATNP
jgi:hypothetical protein